jgi:hypothetical protein
MSGEHFLSARASSGAYPPASISNWNPLGKLMILTQVSFLLCLEASVRTIRSLVEVGVRDDIACR